MLARIHFLYPILSTRYNILLLNQREMYRMRAQICGFFLGGLKHDYYSIWFNLTAV
jgi:hypothetical protein